MKVTVQYGQDFELDGVKFRVYDRGLWSDGGEWDDQFLRKLPDLDDEFQSFEIEITDTEIHWARSHQEILAQDDEDAPEPEDQFHEDYETALAEFHQLASFSGGYQSSRYTSDIGYEFVTFLEIEEAIPQPEHVFIRQSVDVREFEGRDYQRLMMTLPFKENLLNT